MPRLFRMYHTNRVRFADRVDYMPVASTVAAAAAYPGVAPDHRSEPRHVKAPRNMASLQQILRNATSGITVVYGNVGRLPHAISYYLDLFFEDARVRSPWWPEMGLDESYEDDGTRCDVLIVLEPLMGSTVERPPYASRMLVFTSHLNLRLPAAARVLAHHEGNVRKVKIPFKGYVDACVLDESTTLGFRPSVALRSHVELEPHQNNVCVDLTHCASVLETYLSLLNACYVLQYTEFVRSWTVAIRPRMLEVLKNQLRECERIVQQKYSKIPCNHNGVNVLLKFYISQFVK